MPYLEDITYSRDDTVAAFTSYYAFLVKMYLSPEDIITPPADGWPGITPEHVAPLVKTDEVIVLLQKLPYLRRPSDDRDHAQGASGTYLADWTAFARWLSAGQSDAESICVVSEGGANYENVPAHVFGLTDAGADNALFLLDTQVGTIDYVDMWGEMRSSTNVEGILDDSYDYAPEEECDSWRQCAWAIPDFFELLKEQFRLLHFIPISPRRVIDVFTTHSGDEEGMVEMLQGIYREHGWPDLELYRQGECLAAVNQAMKERYPESRDPLDDTDKEEDE